jgi:nicotinamide mononucleotide transporter
LAALFADVSILEAVSVAFGLAYLVLAIRQSALCWPAALISVGLSLVLFYDARLYMEAALQVFYLAMAVYGWYQWLRGGAEHRGVEVSRWGRIEHFVCGVSIVVLTASFGWALARYTDAALPLVDSFTTIGALFATYMVAKKVLETWIYWFVIDAVSIYLYVSRGLMLYALLFVVYLVLVVIAYRQWLEDLRSQTQSPAVAHA